MRSTLWLRCTVAAKCVKHAVNKFTWTVLVFLNVTVKGFLAPSSEPMSNMKLMALLNCMSKCFGIICSPVAVFNRDLIRLPGLVQDLWDLPRLCSPQKKLQWVAKPA